MTVFFTADNHLFHKNVLDFEDRPYETEEEMRNDIIKKWNEQVGHNDIIYIVGDFSLGHYTDTIETLEKLNGRKRMIKGNHDYSKVWDKIAKKDILEEYHEVGIKIKYEKQEIWISHYPMEIGLRPRKWSIHGHIHSLESTWNNQINVGMDSPHFKHKPFGELITIEEIYAIMLERAPEIERRFLESRG